MVKIINQSQYAEITSTLRSEIEAQVLELGDAFSGPVVIRDVPNHEGTHFAVSCGQVWSLINTRGNLRKEPKRIGSYYYNKYCHCSLGSIHTIIIDTFYASIDFCITDINHKDEIKGHNFMIFNDDLTLNETRSNLERITHRANCNYGTVRARISATIKENGSSAGENNSMYHHEYTEETLEKMRKPKSEEHKAHMRAAKKWYKNINTGHLVPLNVLSGMINRGTTTKREWEPINND